MSFTAGWAVLCDVDSALASRECHHRFPAEGFISGYRETALNACRINDWHRTGKGRVICPACWKKNLR